MADKRIIELANEKLLLSDGDMTIVDSESGTYKYDLNRLAKKTITDTTLSVEGKPADAKAVGDALASVDVDTVNNARQLLSESYVLDQEPYLFRASGGDGADRVEECIVGGSVGWNQLCDSASVTVTSGHKYISKVSGTWTVGTSTGSAITGLTSGTDMVIDLTTLFGPTIADYIYSLEQSTAGAGVAWFRKYSPEDYYEYSAPVLKHVEGVSAKEVVGFNLMDFELYQMVVSSTHSLDTSKAVRVMSGCKYEISFESIENATSWRFGIYCFDLNGTRLLSGVLSNGGDLSFNGSANYYVNGANITSKSSTFTTLFDGYVMPFVCAGNTSDSTVVHKGCLHLYGDGTKSEQYEAYHKNIYPLDSTLTLRGIPKLTDGKMWFDGDKYEADGTVARNTILRAYQSGDESLANAITDGTNTVVYSANASTETATPYTSLQTLDPHGTEEFVSTGIVPVGHESHYLENLRSKIEGLPRDFSTLIAPTEETYKATRNYTVGSLLIVDNVLYKATANIANGATITPNTNVTATTLAAVIAAL